MKYQTKRFLLPAHISAMIYSVFFSITCAYGHSPHDVVQSIAISPDYENDQTAFIFVFDEFKRSTDGGHSWTNLENGLDNPSGLISDIATSQDSFTKYYVFVSTRGDGIYRSTDRGENWQPVNFGLNNPDIRRLELSPDFDNDKTLVSMPHQGKGLFISTNAGDSWQEFAHDKFFVNSATIVKDNGTTRLLVGTDTGELYLSDKSFNNWTKQNKITDAGKITDLSYQISDNKKEVIFIGTELKGLYKTYDNGMSITRLPLPAESVTNKNETYITSVVAMENALGTADVFVTGWHESVFFSSDSGNSWRKLNNGLRKDEQADEFKTAHFYKIAIPPGFSRHGNAFVAGFAGLFKTANNGQSWIELETRPARNIEGMAVSPSFSRDRTIALATYDGGAYVSQDSGETWITSNFGLLSTHLWGIAIVNDGNGGRVMYAISNPAFYTLKETSSAWLPNRLATTKYWKYVTANFAADSIITKIAWRILGAPETPFLNQIAVSPDFSSDQTLFLGSRYRGILKSTDGGSTWSHPWTADGGWVLSLKLSPNFDSDKTVFAAIQKQGFYISTDGGHSWQLRNNGLSQLAVNYDLLGTSVIGVSPDFALDHRIYFGTADGLYLSTDYGKNWERLKVSGDEKWELIKAVGISPDFAEDGTILVSVKGKGLFKSVNKGKTFSAISPDLIRNHKVMKLFIFSPGFANDQTIFAASAEEAFVSHDTGTSWERIERPIRYEDTKDSIAYEGTWERRSSATSSALNIHRSNIPGAKAVFHFVGRQITWYGPRSEEYGMAKVFLDGKLIGKVDQFSTAPKDFTPLFTIDKLPWGAHTLTIEVDNDKNNNASGHFIAIDALEVS